MHVDLSGPRALAAGSTKGIGQVVFISSESGIQIPTGVTHSGFTKSAITGSPVHADGGLGRSIT